MHWRHSLKPQTLFIPLSSPVQPFNSLPPPLPRAIISSFIALSLPVRPTPLIPPSPFSHPNTVSNFVCLPSNLSSFRSRVPERRLLSHPFSSIIFRFSCCLLALTWWRERRIDSDGKKWYCESERVILTIRTGSKRRAMRAGEES